MTKTRSCLLAGLIYLILVCAPGCGQKGPLYLDDTPDVSAERATPKDKERQKELKSLEQQNDSQPEITY